MYGFLVGTLAKKHADAFFATMPARVASGEIRYKEHREMGLGSAGEALVGVLKGGNFGKCVVVVAEE